MKFILKPFDRQGSPIGDLPRGEIVRCLNPGEAPISEDYAYMVTDEEEWPLLCIAGDPGYLIQFDQIPLEARFVPAEIDIQP